MSDNTDDYAPAAPAFARGIAGPLGKLDKDLKTKVDEHTEELFRRQCAMNGSDTSSVLRDCVYALVYQRTYTQMVADKASHEAKRIEALKMLTGPFGGPECGAGGQTSGGGAL